MNFPEETEFKELRRAPTVMPGAGPSPPSPRSAARRGPTPPASFQCGSTPGKHGLSDREVDLLGGISALVMHVLKKLRRRWLLLLGYLCMQGG